jgi:diaminopimelate epimerase
MDFVKLDAAGNDFIALDVRSRGADWRPDSRDALLWCDRRHGVGADGILLLGPGADGLDYHLTFLNPDGSEAFCGNGARAAFAWWRSLMGTDGHLPADARFSAVDGRHEGHWIEDEPCVDLHVKATPVDTPHGAFVHTGTEHLVLGTAPEDLAGLDLIGLAEPIRQHPDFAPHGVNVNVVSTAPGPDGRYAMRTFEKGVEGETLSCGSGTVAAAAVLRWQNGGEAFTFAPPGGKLGVVFEGADRAWLSGPVNRPFAGVLSPGLAPS